MKPYDRRDGPVRGRKWKIDYHLHDKNHRKRRSWWEDMSDDGIDRGAIKQRVKKQIEKEIENE